MPASSRILQRHWASIDDRGLRATWRAGCESLSAFSAATANSGSLIQSWIHGAAPVEFEHYPSDDVVDLRSGSQFFYHSHRTNGVEHGHVHLFWHATRSGRRRYVSGLSSRWKRTAPTHLVAVALDNRGLPVSIFTVNRWVTDGHWFDAETTMSFVDRFRIREPGSHQDSAAWLVGFMRMYRPVIREVLHRRDGRLARRKDLEAALNDRGLELLSQIEIDWQVDLDALEGEVTRRGRALRP